MLTLILAALGAVTPTAVEAERAFSRDARRNGQWTASRDYADPDAVIFSPKAIWARDFLRGRRDPPAATLKRAVDLMDKKKVRAFTEIVRAFTMKGGTFLALAHTNKNPGPDGKPVPEGTGDVMNDFDTVYLLDSVGEVKGSGDRLVEFACIKSRGEVGQRVHYSYDPDPSLSYLDRLLSIQEIDPEEAKFAVARHESLNDADVIDAVEMSILHRSGTKMDTVRSASMATGESHRSILSVLERFTGDDPLLHRWNFKRAEHGRMKYFLLARPDDEGPTAA